MKRKEGCKAEEGCDREAVKMGFCNTHYMQVKRGTRSPEGVLLKELRARYSKEGILCTAVGCRKAAFARSFCTTHYQQFRFGRIDDAGNVTSEDKWVSYYNPNRTTPGTAGPCAITGCERQRVDSKTGFCGYHYRRLKLGIIDSEGNLLREEYRVNRYGPEDLCVVEGCDRQARANHFCKYHSQRFSSGLIDAEGKTLRSPALGQPRKKNPRWNQHGYIKVRAPEGHPFSDQHDMVFEHRLVMEQRLGRFLNPWEIIHHKNGKKEDNRIENLELMDRRAGKGERHPRAGGMDIMTAAQVLLQQEDLPEKLKKELEEFLKKKAN